MVLTCLNGISVFLYGTLLTLSFLKIKPTQKNILTTIFLSLGILSSQMFFIIIGSFDIVNKLYPFIVHLPLCLLCILYYKKTTAASIFAVLAAYLLTEPRNWLGLILTIPIKDYPYALELTKLLVTLPILILLLRFLSPEIKNILNQPTKILWLQMLPFAIYYIIAYSTTVYTKLLYNTNIHILTLVMTLFTMMIFVLSSVVSRQNARVTALQQTQDMLRLQSSETKLRLEQIQTSQQEVRIIRHDIRHYFQMIDSYAAAGELDAIRDYIKQLNSKIDETIVKRYCLNEQVNLVLSSSSRKAQEHQVSLTVNADIPADLDDTKNLDLCILLANALENAINASSKTNTPWIELHAGSVGSKLVIQIQNSCSGQIVFNNGIPSSKRPGHGFGSLSIGMLAEKHGGTADFSCEDCIFTLNAVI